MVKRVSMILTLNHQADWANGSLRIVVPLTAVTLTATADDVTRRDIMETVRHLIEIKNGRGSIDDIDHLGNRRLRTIDELASEELRKGFLKLRRTVQERMSLKDAEDMTPRSLVNPKSVSAAKLRSSLVAWSSLHPAS